MFTGFQEEDFQVFSVPGLDARMAAIKQHVRPKLEALGQHFTAFLAPRLGEEVYAHVAKHARRTVNPPNDTWVAFSTNARGYKQHPHFQIGLWQTHVFVTFGYIYESPRKGNFGERLARSADQVHAQIADDFIYVTDHTNPASIPASEVAVGDIVRLGERLQTVKKAELLVGKRWERDTIVQMSGEQFMTAAEAVMAQLVPLYRL
ncbi:YktB family protein [Alicyclobacillus acidoterrestris]|uniref:UPF0637 protein K1I37_04595 n=1 Tax=Alicyclobacillus acidoterrestris (strain ATCC 49025 / DSM 3922 / CIP 106132 / NCIMB 13137 / GD3B) TaxID=1356854 RepID=T0BQJ0_ALIAG|nr:DUF1054 domain-containing protein [Alicyclobacillus acidoterrestris]EPZ42999.1 hypothetical protein N007_01275 [Alicyclobacillus acidoterrestris ATCC 49025]UNO49793.1 DUF1054 domain-containing protein [Alicyclobacillus acidoterrestris]